MTGVAAVDTQLSLDLDLAFLVWGLEARDEVRLMSGEGLMTRLSDDLFLRLRDGLYTRAGNSSSLVVIAASSFSSKCYRHTRNAKNKK